MVNKDNILFKYKQAMKDYYGCGSNMRYNKIPRAYAQGYVAALAWVLGRNYHDDHEDGFDNEEY